MVLNNYNAMVKAEQFAQTTAPLAPGSILDLHKVVTRAPSTTSAMLGVSKYPARSG